MESYTRSGLGKTKKLVMLALFTAIIVVLQSLGTFIRFGMFAITPVLVPIVIGAALYGPLAGGYLGAVFGVVVLVSGDAASFMVIDPVGTVLTVMCKGICSGLFAGLVYRLLQRINPYVAVVVAAVVCPVVNTGIFLIGCVLFFMEAVSAWAVELGFANATEYMFLGLAGGNFLFELLLNVILAPVIVRLIRIGKKTA